MKYAPIGRWSSSIDAFNIICSVDEKTKHIDENQFGNSGSIPRVRPESGKWKMSRIGSVDEEILFWILADFRRHYLDVPDGWFHSIIILSPNLCSA